MLSFCTSLSLTIWTLAWLPSSFAACYHPDKTEANLEYQPCFPDRPSMCCATNRVGDSFTPKNKCRPDGLCWEMTGTQYIYRESCTDPTWNDPACLKLCMDTPTDVLVTTCGDGSYCCGGSNQTDCCQKGGGFWISAGKVYPYNQSPFTTGTLNAQSTATGSAQTTQQNGSDSDIPLDQKLAAARLGIGLGVGLGVGIPFLLLLMAFVILLRRRNTRTNPQQAYQAGYPKPDYSPEYSSAPAAKVAPHQEVGYSHPELASNPRMELEGDHVHKP